MTRARRVVIVGGGITGLSAAYFLRQRRPDLELVLLESAPRLGGNIATEKHDGFVIDAGPDSFLRTKPQAEKLCREIGLGEELVAPRPEARHVFLVHHGELVEMPGGMVLSVPTKLQPLLTTPLISLPGKLRMLGDLLLPRAFQKNGGRDESISDFVTRRFGAEAVDSIAAPLLGGIYAGDPRRLSVRATFPQLVDLEERYGSVLLGMSAKSAGIEGKPTHSLAERARVAKSVWKFLRRSDEAQAPSPFLSLRGGMGTLVARLAERLDGVVRVDSAVESIEPMSGSRGYLVKVRARTQPNSIAIESESLEADAVLLATPAHVAARLLPQGALATELSLIPYTSTATVFFSFARSGVSHPLLGSGFVAPRGESDLIAGTWVSSKWDGRAPEGQVLMRAFLGGVHGVSVPEESDEGLVATARFELERLLGDLGPASITRVHRFERKNPLPELGHPERLKRLAQLASALPCLHLAGAAYDGVGIPDCVRQAEAAARQIAEELGAGPAAQ